MLNSNEIEKLTILVEEAIRANEAGVKRFVEPARGTRQQAANKTHCIIFGRRGSGKSSLLRRAKGDLTLDRRPIAYVDLETFKGHSYPDVLVSVLLRTFAEFKIWLDTAAVFPATKKSFWMRLYYALPTRASYNQKGAQKLSNDLATRIKELETLLHSPEQIDTKRVSKQEADRSTEAYVKAEAGELIKAGTQYSGSESSSQTEELHESFQSNKIDSLRRHIMDYQAIFREMENLSSGDSFLFLDDLYFIRRADQAKVIDYFHTIGKGNGLWLKVGTIRYRTDWYIHGDPPIGMKLADDAQEINLDLTLERYESTKQFLLKILEGFLTESGNLRLDEIMSENAIDRLVLASGGVARDFLGIFGRSIIAARNRGTTNNRQRIGVEDVNNASGSYSITKREEFKIDTADNSEQTSLEESFSRVKEFCFEQSNANLFLVQPIEGNPGYEAIQKLVDLRLVHKAVSNVTISKRQGERFEAYMLDVSEYTHSRKRRDFNEIKFWGKDHDNIRRLDLVLDTNLLVGKRQPPIEAMPKRGAELAKPKGAKNKKAAHPKSEQLRLDFEDGDRTTSS